MIRTLVLLRHGKSDWSGGEADVDRPLAPRGRRQAPEAGRWIAANLPRLDLAVVSPAARARATWDLAAAELDQPPPVTVEPAVYAAGADRLLEVLTALEDDLATVVLVGHNPGLEDLAGALADPAGDAARMTTAALAVLALPGRWADLAPGSATLRVAGRPPGPVGS